MRRITIALALFLCAYTAQAQHALQVDNAAGKIGIIDGSLLTADRTFSLPDASGTVLMITGANTLTINSNSFNWPDPAAGYLYNNGGGVLSWAAAPGGGTNNIAWGGHTNGVGNGQKHYAMPNGFIGAVLVGSEENVCVIVPVACTVTSLFVRFTTAPDIGSATPGNQEYVIRVRNRTDNTVSAGVTISESELTDNSVALSLAFDAGDEMNIEFDPTSSTTNDPTMPGRVAFGVLAMVP